jgi:hypothetical protein
MLRALGVQDARARIRTALAARAQGARGFLDAEDEETLARLLAEAPPVPEHQLAALREGRLLRIVSHLNEHYGITGGRLIVLRTPVHETDHLAGVRVQVAIGRAATTPLQDRQ